MTTRRPADPELPRTDPAPRRLALRLSDAASCWVSGGPVTDWSLVHGRYARPAVTPGQQARCVFTQIADPFADPTIRGWMEHQRMHVAAPALSAAEPAADEQTYVFWRLAVRHRAVAIDAVAARSREAAGSRARRLLQRVGELEVALGFFPGRPVPSWVVCERGVPAIIGLPDYHLVPTLDAATSLGAVLLEARVQSEVRVVQPESGLTPPRPGRP